MLQIVEIIQLCEIAERCGKVCTHAYSRGAAHDSVLPDDMSLDALRWWRKSVRNRLLRRVSSCPG